MCDCIPEINKALEEHNTKLDIPISLNIKAGKFRPLVMKVATTKLDTKKKAGPVTLFASYCPICGVEYEEVEEK